jgi:hypothetical protein
MKKGGKMKVKITRIMTLLILISSMSFISCGQQKSDWQGTITEENGISVVKNPKMPIYGEDVFVLEEELSIGEAEGREEYMFSEVASIASDNKERIYVLDYKENNVTVYDRDGEYVNQFGEQGQGPGEFFLPRSVIITNQDEILVQNFRSFDLFSMDGVFTRSISTAKYSLATSDLDTEGNIISTDIVRDDENPRYELKKFDPDMNHLHSLGSSPLPNSARDGFNPLFPVFRWALTNGNQIVFGYMKEYELKIFNPDGSLARKILRDYEPVKVTQKDIDERLQGENLPPQLKATMVIPEYHCPFRWIIADDEGRIFVMTYERVEDGEGDYYDVFDNQGKFIVKVPLKARPLSLKNGKLYTVEEDEDGYQYVKRYKVTWNY